MATQSTSTALQSAPAGACHLPGTWKIAAGRAVTLSPREAGTLRVMRGRIWATLEGAHQPTPDQCGDLVLAAGETLRLRAGDRLVVEPFRRGDSADFSWDPVPETQAARLSAGLARPLADLRLALVILGRALAGLALGLLGLAWGRLTAQRAPAGRAATP